MNSTTQLGVDAWISHRSAWLASLGMWGAGIALAAASIWHVEHPAMAAPMTGVEMHQPESSAPCDVTPSDTVPSVELNEPIDESTGAVFLPQDVIIAHEPNAPTLGATELQSP